MLRYQTFGKRFLALVVDFIVLAPTWLLFFWIDSENLSDLVRFALEATFSIFYFLYGILLHWKYGQTLGKMLLRVKVLDVSEKEINFWQSCLREILYVFIDCAYYGILFSLLFVGYSWWSDAVVSLNTYILCISWAFVIVDTIVCVKNRKFRALHDYIAGTVVVRLDVPGDAEIGETMHFEPPSPDYYDFSSDEDRKTLK